jgi:hypothetical protein
MPAVPSVAPAAVSTACTCAGSVDITGADQVVSGLAVDPPYRRRELATALLDEARGRFPALRPGPVTDDGAAFLAAYAARTGWPA